MAKRDLSIDRMALKALVAVFGPREAARKSGIPFGTISSLCYRFKWHKAKGLSPAPGNSLISGKDPAEAITEVMAQHREEATVNLAHFAAKASRQALEGSDPLGKARAVRDVAAVYRTIYPPESGGELIEGSILIGEAQVKDDPVEMLANVREIVSDQGPQGH